MKQPSVEKDIEYNSEVYPELLKVPDNVDRMMDQFIIFMYNICKEKEFKLCKKIKETNNVMALSLNTFFELEKLFYILLPVLKEREHTFLVVNNGKNIKLFDTNQLSKEDYMDVHDLIPKLMLKDMEFEKWLPTFISKYGRKLYIEQLYKDEKLWKFTNFKHTYKIPPINIEPLNVNYLYNMYLEQKFTDFTISTNNRDFHVHKVLLYAHGGNFIQTFFNTNVGKANNHKLLLSHYNNHTIQLYIKFVYKDVAAFNKMSNIDMDTWIKLYKLAHYLDFERLLKYILNIINWKSCINDIPKLKNLYEIYRDEYLKKILHVLL